MGGQRKTTATIDNDEVAHFSRLSSQWWDAHGPLRALHKFNPLPAADVSPRLEPGELAAEFEFYASLENPDSEEPS